RATGDADWTYLRLRLHGRSHPRAVWEQAVVTGAFRDLLCAARAPLLWTRSDQTYPYLQRFPSPPERVFRRRLAKAAHRWHFRVLDARYLRPLQGAPMVVVQTHQPFRLAHAAGKIRRFLDPVKRNASYQLGAWTYEGFYFEAEDAHNR